VAFVDPASRLIVGGVKTAEPVIMTNQQTGERVGLPQVAATILSDQIVLAIVENTVGNIMKHLVLALQDRCAFVLDASDGGDRCGITRVTHNSPSHDFTEPPVPAPPGADAAQE
jgi:hypothetical protein